MGKRIDWKVYVAAAIVVVAGVGFAGNSWWTHNRMIFPCLLLGVWGDGGPGFEWYLRRHDNQMDTPDVWPARLNIVGRHWPHTKGACAPADAEKHWVLVERLSAERDWAEANFMFAMKLGYGDFYGNPFFDWNEDGIRKMIPGLGDGKNLDLEQSFALLQKAAVQGYVLAQFALGWAHQLGAWGKDGALKIGVDSDLALSWMEKAAAQGDESAVFYIREYSASGKKGK